MNILVLGWNPSLIADITEEAGTRVWVIEEPSLQHEISPAVTGIAARYQQDDEYQSVVVSLREHFDLILPGREYGVPAAHWLSEHFGLPSIGTLAVRASVDKSFLRASLSSSALPLVRSAVMTGQTDVEDFFDGHPIVLKPTNRHASIGVIRISAYADIPDAWAAATQAAEGSGTIDRDLTWTYLAENWVPGREYSVESIFSEVGDQFHNITEKTVIGDGRFTPLRHIVPASLPPDERAELISAQETLARALKIKRGLVHAEWKKDGDRCWIIEFAVRYPGGRIPQLIMSATGVNLARAWMSSLLGRMNAVVTDPVGVAGVAFIHHPAGRFQRIEGLPGTASRGVIAVGWNAAPGDLLLPLDDAEARMGFVAVHGDNHAEVTELLDGYMSAISVLVSDDT